MLTSNCRFALKTQSKLINVTLFSFEQCLLNKSGKSHSETFISAIVDQYVPHPFEAKHILVKTIKPPGITAPTPRICTKAIRRYGK